MVSTFTPNVQIEEPARGDYVGTWDTPVNANMTLIDLIVGGRTTISGAAGSVTLSAAQFQCKTITVNSTLLASIQVVFPSSFTKSYEIQNLCTGSSAFVINLAVNGSSGESICCPPGEIFEIINDGTSIKFKNFGRVGSYWDYAGSSVPAWVTGCTVPPYLNCDAGTFSSATYPQLAVILGSTTLPDSRGSVRFALDQGAGRISSATDGFSGSSVGSRGGSQTVTIGTSNLPPYTPSGSVSAPTVGGAAAITAFSGSIASAVSPGAGIGVYPNSQQGVLGAPTFTGTAQGGVSDPMTNLPPALIGGLTLIRAG